MFETYRRFSLLMVVVGLLGITVEGWGDNSVVMQNLESPVEEWHVYVEGSPIPDIGSAGGGELLRCSITGGAPYSNVHCYRNLAFIPNASKFCLSLWFGFNPSTTFNNQDGASVVQALEFTMNSWDQQQRFEWALQWQNVGDGAPQWRYWDPHQSERWVSLGIPGVVAGNQWHALSLEGEIVNGQVYYKRFTIDQESHTLNKTVSPFADSGVADKLAVAVQQDGNAAESAYAVYLDQVNFVVNGSCAAGSTPPFPIPTPLPAETPSSNPTAPPVNPASIPEPGMLFLVATGLIGILMFSRKTLQK